MKKPFLLALAVGCIGLFAGASMPEATPFSTHAKGNPPDIIVPGKYVTHTPTTLTCAEGKVCAVIKVRIDKPFGSMLVVNSPKKYTFKGAPVFAQGSLTGFQTQGRQMNFQFTN